MSRIRYSMKQSYAETRWMPVRLRGFVDLVRPFTLIAPFLGCVLGILAATGATGQTAPWTDILYAAITLAMVNAASNALNQASDVASDTISKPYRPIPQGIVTAEEARFVAYTLYALALFRSGTISEWFAVLMLAIVVTTIFYNMEPVRFKRRGWWANVAIAVPRGMLGFVAAWSIVADPIDAIPWVLGALMMIYLIGAQNSKDYSDVLGDKAAGIITPVIKYGPEKTAWYSLPFLMAPGILTTYLGSIDFIPEAGMYLGALILFCGAMTAHLMINHRRQNFQKLENSPSWAMMYLTLLVMMLGFAIMYWV